MRKTIQAIAYMCISLAPLAAHATTGYVDLGRIGNESKAAADIRQRLQPEVNAANAAAAAAQKARDTKAKDADAKTAEAQRLAQKAGNDYAAAVTKAVHDAIPKLPDAKGVDVVEAGSPVWARYDLTDAVIRALGGPAEDPTAKALEQERAKREKAEAEAKDLRAKLAAKK